MPESLICKNSWETNLPDGWKLGRVYRGKRILFYKELKVASVEDNFNLEKNVLDLVENPTAEVQVKMVEAGISNPELITDIRAQKMLVRKGYISNDSAYRLFPELHSWIDKQKPAVSEYANKRYKRVYGKWVTEEGNLLDNRHRFISSWDARVQYAKGSCSLREVAEYSWAVVLECLGDDHQRLYNYIKNLAAGNKKSCVQEAKRILEYKEKENLRYAYSYPAAYEDYKKTVNSTLWDHFTSSIDNSVMMFTMHCDVSGFEWVYDYVRKYTDSVLSEISSYYSRLVSFRWDSGMQSYQPVLAPKPLTADKFQEFCNLVRDVIAGKKSGYEARLEFTNGYYKKVQEESRRYQRTRMQFIPYYRDVRRKLQKKSISFNAAVRYVYKTVQELAVLGFRSSSRESTSFVYGDLKFKLDFQDKKVSYIGYARGSLLSSNIPKMSVKEWVEYLPDEQERRYQEKAYKKFNRLFSYLQNVVHKGMSLCHYQKDKRVAARKYLKPSPRFLKILKEAAEQYINDYERSRGVLC